MADRRDVLLAYYNDHAARFRHYDSQRAVVVAASLVLAAAALAFLTTPLGDQMRTWLGLFLIVLGLIGAALNHVYHHRRETCRAVAVKSRKRLEEEREFQEILMKAREQVGQHRLLEWIYDRGTLIFGWILELAISALGLAVLFNGSRLPIQ